MINMKLIKTSMLGYRLIYPLAKLHIAVILPQFFTVRLLTQKKYLPMALTPPPSNGPKETPITLALPEYTSRVPIKNSCLTYFLACF